MSWATVMVLWLAIFANRLIWSSVRKTVVRFMNAMALVCIWCIRLSREIRKAAQDFGNAATQQGNGNEPSNHRTNPTSVSILGDRVSGPPSFGVVVRY
jgi:hypothetical protein